MESVKDYLDRLEINNNILNKQLKDVYVSKVVYFREDKIVYFHLTSKSIISYDILDSLKEELKLKLSYFKDILKISCIIKPSFPFFSFYTNRRIFNNYRYS